CSCRPSTPHARTHVGPRPTGLSELIRAAHSVTRRFLMVTPRFPKMNKTLVARAGLALSPLGGYLHSSPRGSGQARISFYSPRVHLSLASSLSTLQLRPEAKRCLDRARKHGFCLIGCKTDHRGSLIQVSRRVSSNDFDCIRDAHVPGAV